MNLKVLSNSELMNRFGKLVQTERKITHLVLECIAEIDTRKIYLERAYPSLYEFLVKEFGYSPSAAVRRIESARLLREVSEISNKIEDGSLNLSQLSKVQQAVRAVQKVESRKVNTEEKRELLFKIENTTQDQTELILSQELALPIFQEEREKIHRNESVTLTISFSKEQMVLLEQVKDLVSHCVPDNKWAEVITYLAKKEVQKRTQLKRPALKAEQKTKETMHVKTQRKSLSPNLRKSIFIRDQCCQYKDPQTNRVCGSKKFLEIDHIKPIWANGNNSPSNLRVLCSEHNVLRYRKQSGLHPLRR